VGRKSTEQDLKAIEVFQKGSRVCSTVEKVIRKDGTVAVLKDYRRCRPLVKYVFGPVFILWETLAYRRLAGLSGIPSFLERTGRTGLLIELIEGKNCMIAETEDFSDDFFQMADELLRMVRSRGVLHFDIGGNLILGRDGQPYLVDFLSSLVIPESLKPFMGPVVELRKRFDERAVLKIKRRRAPHLLCPEELECSRVRLPFEPLIRFMENQLNRAVRFLNH